MSTKPIQNTDIASPDVYTKLITETKELLEIYKTLDVELTKVVKNVAKVSQGYKSNVAGDIQKAAAAEKQLTQAMLDSEKIKRAKIQTEKSLISLQQQKKRAAQSEIKQRADLKNAYTQDSRTLNTLRNNYKNLAAQNKANTREAKLLLKEITRLDTKLKGIDKTVGQSQRNVGNYTSAISKLRGGMTSLLGVASRLGLVMGGGMIVRNTVNIIKDYEQANANLASILGVTADQTEKLQKLQLELGGSTSFTAAQVAELQTEYAKLGFTQEEILKATEGTLFLAKAANTDLANAAEIAGSTLRAFNLDASEMGRVTDVMAKSFSTSALDIEKFKESMKLVAPIASAAGVSLEEATAMLGALANAGISGSMAGTSLRRILNEMALTGKPAAEALKELSEQGISLADAEDEVGKNAQTALLVLSNQMDTVSDLTKEYENATGTAKQMANVQDNTLGGALARLNSAWQAFILNLNQSSGAGRNLRNVIEFLANNLTTILNIVGQAVTVFAAYKTALFLSRVQSEYLAISEQVRAKGLSSLFAKQKDLTKATNDGAKAQKNFNEVGKNLIISGILVFIGNLASAWYDVASGAKNARLQSEAYQKAQQIGNEKASKFATEQREKMEQELRDIRKLGLSEDELQQEREKIQKKYIAQTDKKILINEVYAKKLESQASILEQINKTIENAQTPETLQILTEKGLKAQEEITKILEELKLQGVVLEDTFFFKEGSFTSVARAGKAGVKELQSEIEGLKESSKNLNIELDELITTDLELKNFNTYDPNNNKAKEELEVIKEIEQSTDVLANLIDTRKSLQEQLNRELEISGDLETVKTENLRGQLKILDQMITKERVLRAAATQQNIPLNKPVNVEVTEEMTEKFKGTYGKKDVEELKAELDSLKQLSEQFTNFTIMLIDRRIEALDRENEAQQRNYDEAKSREQELIELRKAGVVNLEESIAFEREAQAKALQEQEKIAKKKQRLELTNSAIQMFNASVQQGGANPLGKTIADVTALVGFIRTLPTFWTGTDSTVGDALGIKYSNGRDGVLARVDASEMILNKSKVDTLKGYGITTTDGIIDAIEMQKFSPKSTNMTSPIVYNDNSEVVSRLDRHEKYLQQIANKPVVQNEIEHFDKMIKISQTITTPKKVQTITKNTRIR